MTKVSQAKFCDIWYLDFRFISDSIFEFDFIPLRQRDHRLALDNGVVIRKGVKGLDHQFAGAKLDVMLLRCPQGHAAAGVELVEHALPHAVFGQFLLEGPKDLGIDRFELEAQWS